MWQSLGIRRHPDTHNIAAASAQTWADDGLAGVVLEQNLPPSLVMDTSPATTLVAVLLLSACALVPALDGVTPPIEPTRKSGKLRASRLHP